MFAGIRVDRPATGRRRSLREATYCTFGFHAALAKMNDELLQVGLGDRGRGVVSFRRNLLRSSERFPRGLIPLARRCGDVVDVGALAEKLLKELF